MFYTGFYLVVLDKKQLEVYRWAFGRVILEIQTYFVKGAVTVCTVARLYPGTK